MSDKLQAWMDRVDAYWYGLLPVIGDATGFTTDRCECCGGLAGERYAVTWTAMERDPGRLMVQPAWDGGLDLVWVPGERDEDDDLLQDGSGEVCVDCALYIANGDTPDHLA